MRANFERGASHCALVDVGVFEDFFVTSIIIYCFYWLQFCTNFFIYAISNEQYRKAFLFFLQNVLFKTCHCRNKPTDRQNPTVFTIREQNVIEGDK